MTPQTDSVHRALTGLLPGGRRRAALVVCAMALLAVNCLTPAVRYTRSEPARREAGSGAVPGAGDHRTGGKVSHDRLSRAIASYLGTRYRSGGMSRRGVDCSGFVCLVYRDVNNAKLPHSTRKLRKLGRVVAPGRSRPGDLVFFRGGPFGSVNHVGIYMGERRFAHAATSSGVIYSSLDEEYYRMRFMEIRRVF